MKLYEHPKTTETLDRLPKLPKGVEVPDDLSGLQPPTTLKPAAGAVRWMRWLAAIVVLGAIGVLAAVLFNGSDNAIETDQVGYDRHLATMADLTIDPITVDYMATYGTDNPAFVIVTPTLGSDRHLSALANQPASVVDTGQYMELYGTDNPVFVQAAPEVTTAWPTEGPGSNSLAP